MRRGWGFRGRARAGTPFDSWLVSGDWGRIENVPQDADDLAIPLEQGGRVRVLAGERVGKLRIWRNGALVAEAKLTRREDALLVVPPGELIVALLEPGAETWIRVAVVVAAREEVQVEL